jgi:hypothetical protein
VRHSAPGGVVGDDGNGSGGLRGRLAARLARRAAANKTRRPVPDIVPLEAKAVVNIDQTPPAPLSKMTKS